MKAECSGTEAQRQLTVEEGACCPLGVTWIPPITANYSLYLKRFYERVKARRGAGRAIIALARKFLGIIYRTLKNKWVFEDFTNFGRRMRRLKDSPPAIQAVFSSGEQNQVEVGNIIGVIDTYGHTDAHTANRSGL